MDLVRRNHMDPLCGAFHSDDKISIKSEVIKNKCLGSLWSEPNCVDFKAKMIVFEAKRKGGPREGKGKVVGSERARNLRK